MSWILIFLLNGSNYHHIQIEDFKTEKECIEAGVQLKKELNASRIEMSFSCIKK